MMYQIATKLLPYKSQLSLEIYRHKNVFDTVLVRVSICIAYFVESIIFCSEGLFTVPENNVPLDYAKVSKYCINKTLVFAVIPKLVEWCLYGGDICVKSNFRLRWFDLEVPQKIGYLCIVLKNWRVSKLMNGLYSHYSMGSPTKLNLSQFICHIYHTMVWPKMRLFITVTSSSA